MREGLSAMDFTLSTYRRLLSALKKAGYTFRTYEDFLSQPQDGKIVVLRHDVDKRPTYSLATARIEAQEGICAVYYFRAVPQSWNQDIIRQISQLGHEVGYHYESMATCSGDAARAYEDFGRNLSALRALVPVRTICMHGSPLSPYDNRAMWIQYNYKDLGLLGEPYLDTDFSQVFYLTDTGRRWNGFKSSMRDKVTDYQAQWAAQGLVFRHTKDIIKALHASRLPALLMLTTHPQRWTSHLLPWFTELVLQNAKNVLKRMFHIVKCMRNAYSGN